MSTNEEIQQRIIKALEDKIGVPKCPLCGKDAWSVGNSYIVISLSPHPSQVHMGGPVYPTIPVTCQHCGNTHLLNLLILGFKQEELDSLRFTEDARQ